MLALVCSTAEGVATGAVKMSAAIATKLTALAMSGSAEQVCTRAPRQPSTTSIAIITIIATVTNIAFITTITTITSITAMTTTTLQPY